MTSPSHKLLDSYKLDHEKYNYKHRSLDSVLAHFLQSELRNLIFATFRARFTNLREQLSY